MPDDRVLSAPLECRDMTAKTERQIERLQPSQLRRLRDDCPVGYLPLGILEWHGVHNPMGLDGVKAHALCVRTAEEAGGVVFPTLYYGPPPAANYLDVDMFDPAITDTYAVPKDHFTTDRFRFGSRLDQWHLFDRVLDQALRQIVRYGFEAIMVVCGHYPLENQQHIATGIIRDFAVPIWMGCECHLLDPPEDGDHAGQWETSLTLALEPDTVAVDAFPQPGQPNPPGVFGEPVCDVTEQLATENLNRTLAAMSAKVTELLDQRQQVRQQYDKSSR